MSLIDNLKVGKRSAEPPSPLQIEEQVNAQRERVLELENAIGLAALDALTGDQAAVERHRKVKADLTAAHEHLALLNAAHAGAIERERIALAANREHIRKTQVAACKKHLTALAGDADALAASLETVVRHYQRMLDHAQKALAATPIGSVIPGDTAVAPGRLKVEVRAALFKLSAPASGGSIGRNELLLFPGCERACPPMCEDQPEKIPAFMSTVREAIEGVLRAIDAPPR